MVSEQSGLKKTGAKTQKTDNTGSFPKGERIVPQHRGTLARRTAPNERGFERRLGYRNIAISYCDDTSINGFSGSSLNRDYAKIVKQQKHEIFEGIKKKAKEFGEDMADLSTWGGVEAKYLFPAQINLQKNKRTGKPRGIGNVKSARTVTKIQEKAYSFLRVCPDPAFVSLTFIEDVGDRKATAVLNTFLTTIREFKKKMKYLWVAERQDNGRIHFHMICSERMPVQKLNAMWVLAQYNAGLSHPKLSRMEMLKRYDVSMRQKGNKPIEGSMGKVLNPVNIKKIHNNDGLSLYITKYVTKSDNHFFESRTWHCSRAVSRLFTKKSCNQDCINEADSKTNTLVTKDGRIIKGKKICKPFFMVIPIINKDHFVRYLRQMEDVNEFIINDIDVGKDELIAMFESLNLN